MLNGQKLQGPETAAEVNYMLKARVSENDCGFDMLHRLFAWSLLLKHCYRASRGTSRCSPRCIASALVNFSLKTCSTH